MGNNEVSCYMQICPHCNEEIPAHFVQQGGLHMNCYDVEIEVWFISLPHDPKRGYYEKDLHQIVDMLKNSEDIYLIERKKMTAGQYYNIPEFEGF